MKGFTHSADVESMLREKIGFGAYPGGTVDRCLTRRMSANGMDDEEAYLSLLYSSSEEQDELVEEIVVPETWFFRDSEPFVYLRKYVTENIASGSIKRPLRALSVPSSTGEEAYSIAITLMEAGLMEDEFSVHAVDVSRRALRKAGEALYAGSSFREKEDELRRKYFDEIGLMFLVRPEVRAAVRFIQGNVLEESDLGPAESCDIVFFRNLLIYLDEASRKRAIRNVERVLRKGGLLVLGYAEPQHVFFPDFIPVDHPRAHASRKSREEISNRCKCGRALPVAAPSVKTGRGSKLPPRISQSPVNGKRSGRLRPAAEPAPDEAGAVPAVDEPDTLRRARVLADSGRYAEAGELVAECLKTDAACIEAHFLLGVTALALGDEEKAEAHLNRVIYLNPNHNDALLHLSLLMDRLGRKEQAARYRKRIVHAGKETLPEVDE